MLENIGVAIFTMCVVFTVLTGIYFCVRIFSWITMKIEGTINDENAKTNI